MKLIVLLIACLAVDGAEAPKTPELPKTPLAVQAKKTYDQQVKWAQAQFDQAIAKARNDYLASLKQALQLALKASNLEESNRIDAEIKSLPEDAKPKPAREAKEEFNIVGTWAFRYSNGTVNDRTIGKDGKVAGGGVVKKMGKDTVIDWGGLIERITPAGDRLFVEHFNPASDYGQKTASVMAEGVRK